MMLEAILSQMPTKLLTGPTKRNLDNRRSLVGDALETQGVVMNAIRSKKLQPIALSSLAGVLCKLIPLICALRGKPLFVSGTVSKRMELSPKEAARQLKALKPLNIEALIADAPAATSDEAASEPSEQKESKESLKATKGVTAG